MGHLLILHDKHKPRSEEIQGRAHTIFGHALGLDLVGCATGGDTRVSLFGTTTGQPTGIVPLERAESGACGVGAWTLDGAAPETALRTVGQEMLRGGPDGPKVPDTLDGSFVIAIWGAGSDGVKLVTDRVGALHCYYASINETVVVSTSSLVLAALIDPEWDPIGVAEFSATGSIFEDRTLFRGIRKLPPASVLTLRGGELIGQRRYWNLAEVAFDRNPHHGTAPDLAQAMVETLQTIVKTFGRPCLDLTGGYDSRAVLAAMLQIDHEFGTVVNGAEEHSDVLIANRIARAFGLSHRHQSLPPDWDNNWWDRAKDAMKYCDGEYDILEYARVLEYHTRLARDFDISVNGSGGEFCKGYWWELLFPSIGSPGHFDERRVAAKRFAVHPLEPGFLRQELPDGLVDHFAGIIRRENVGLEAYPNTAQMDNVYLSLRMQRWYGRIASSTNQIWPCVSPFMFRKPLEIALAAPPSARVRNHMSCDLLEHLDLRLASLPLADGYPAVRIRPSNVHLFLPKYARLAAKVRQRAFRQLGFGGPTSTGTDPSLAQLMRNEEVRDHLNPGRMLSRNLYDERVLAAYLARMAEAPTESAMGRMLTLERLARVIRDVRLAAQEPPEAPTCIAKSPL